MNLRFSKKDKEKPHSSVAGLVFIIEGLATGLAVRPGRRIVRAPEAVAWTVTRATTFSVRFRNPSTF